MVMAKLGVEKGELPEEDYRIPYEETIPLLRKGLIKEQKVRINKPEEVAPAPAPEPESEPAKEAEPVEEVAEPVEEAYQELAKEEGMEIVESKVNNDGDVVLVEKDAKGNIFEIRFIKSFTAKLSQAEDGVKDYYTGLKNYALAYKKANSRVSWHYDAVNVGREMVIKFAIRGKTLCLFFALAKDGLDSKYKVEDAKGKKFEDVPVLYRIKNDRRYNYAKDLIDMVMAKVGAEKGEEPNVDYRIPYESEFYGDKVTEDNLDKKNNGGVSTSSTKGFYNEINDSIKNKEFVSKTYLKNDVLLKEIHASLKNNNPVAIEWAAKYEDEWTLHFSLVTSLDLNGDNATVYNPYGYIETLNISEFLDRTTFEAFESMPLFLNFGFAFGAFDKNAIFYLK